MTSFATGGGKIDPEGFLKVVQMLFRPGYAQGLTVTQRASGANMSVDINPATIGGGALVVTSAGIPYFGWIDTSTPPNATVATAHATLVRIDSVVAYVDLTAISSSVTNNQGAFKFLVVSGTAGSGSAPSGSAIQTALTAAGATGAPYTVAGNITLPAAAATVVNAYITDARTPAAFQVPYLWGGSSNTKGHLVPNQADGTLVTTTDTNSVNAAMLATSAITLGYAQITGNFTTASTTAVQITGLTTTVTIPAGGRRIKISYFGDRITVGAVADVILSIWDGVVGSGTQLAEATNTVAGVGYQTFVTCTAIVTPPAGAKTYNIGVKVNTGSLTLVAGATAPAFILVEAI